MWMRKGDGEPVLIPARMSETVERCLREGWVECPDPRGQAARPEPDTEAVVEQPKPAQVRAVAGDIPLVNIRATRVHRGR